MDSKVSALSTLGSVDRATDFLYVVDTSGTSSTKMTVNGVLGITGNPVGTTDSQTLTNKILTTPTISSPVLSGTVTGTYTLGGTPTFPSSVATLTGVQTLTNKTLTAPIITNGSASNIALSLNAISEFTAGFGVTVDGLLIKDGTVPDDLITPAKLLAGTGTSWAWQSWVPTWANLTVGNGVNASTYRQIGKNVYFKLKFTLGTTSSVGSAPTFSLPVTSISYGGAFSAVIGSLALRDDSVPANVPGFVWWASTTTAEPDVMNAAATYVVGNALTSAVPFTWTTGDVIQAIGMYEAA